MKHSLSWKAKSRLAAQSSPLMEHGLSLPYSVEILTGAHRASDEFSPQPDALFPEEAYPLPPAPTLGAQRYLSPSSIPTKI